MGCTTGKHDRKAQQGPHYANNASCAGGGVRTSLLGVAADDEEAGAIEGVSEMQTD